MAQDKIRRLELRIQELENQLKGFGGGAEAIDLSPEDIAGFTKVQAALGQAACLSECRVCIINRCVGSCIVACRCFGRCACIVECTCGPCMLGGGGLGGLSRFEGMAE